MQSIFAKITVIGNFLEVNNHVHADLQKPNVDHFEQEMDVRDRGGLAILCYLLNGTTSAFCGTNT